MLCTVILVPEHCRLNSVNRIRNDIAYRIKIGQEDEIKHLHIFKYNLYSISLDFMIIKLLRFSIASF